MPKRHVKNALVQIHLRVLKIKTRLFWDDGL